MLKEFKRTQIMIQNVLLEVQGFGFKNEKNLEVVPGYVNILQNEQNEDPHLLSICTWVGNHAIIRTGPIDSAQKVMDHNILLKEIHSDNQKRGFNAFVPFRVSILQSNMPDIEWDFIRFQHYILLTQKLENLQQEAHINFPADPIFQHAKDETKTLLLQKTDNKLSRQINARGWLQYCEWLNKELGSLFKTIQFDALDEYQLEASVKDFSHEMNSPLLKEYCKQEEELVLKLGHMEFSEDPSKIDIGYQNLIELEKKLLKMRMEMQSNLQHIYDVIDTAIGRISKIDKFHPELTPIRHISLLLNSLIETQVDFTGAPKHSWGQQIMLLGLLDLSFGAISVVNCDKDMYRTNFAFAIKLAVVQLMQAGGGESVIDLAIHWDEASLQINKLLIGKGQKGIQEIINQSEEHPLLSQRAKLVKNFRLFVWENLRQLKVRKETSSVTAHPGLNVRVEYLNYLPAFIVENGVESEVIIYNEESGFPKAMTPQGFKLFSSNF